jgi:uncharacterized membrane protein
VSAASRSNVACVVALFGLQVAWHGLRLWPGGSVALLLILGLPSALVLLLLALRRPSAHFWSGVIALLTFCHGVTEAWTVPGAGAAGLGEAALSVASVLTASWDGMRARFAGKTRAPPAV